MKIILSIALLFCSISFGQELFTFQVPTTQQIQESNISMIVHLYNSYLNDGEINPRYSEIDTITFDPISGRALMITTGGYTQESSTKVFQYNDDSNYPFQAELYFHDYEENYADYEVYRTFEYTYDDNGKMISLALYNDKGKLFDVDYYSYDSKGRLISLKNGNGEIIKGEERYIYDDNTRTYEHIDSYDKTIKYELNEKGDIVATYAPLYSGGFDKNDYENQYDSSGRIISTIRSRDGILISKKEYHYNFDGNLREEAEYFNSQGQWRITKKHLYIYLQDNEGE